MEGKIPGAEILAFSEQLKHGDVLLTNLVDSDAGFLNISDISRQPDRETLQHTCSSVASTLVNYQRHSVSHKETGDSLAIHTWNMAAFDAAYAYCPPEA